MLSLSLSCPPAPFPTFHIFKPARTALCGKNFPSVTSTLSRFPLQHNTLSLSLFSHHPTLLWSLDSVLNLSLALG
ncbi:hypothetical protein VNO78_33923 [Psophocarpus tetragonolobus]|uniref:Uncharacterized protein n=1 Tax=Psophocarpus tetragonolobus TaxID=3891 RepID=A0AAN9RQZ2_PSOTE